jgi:hypothetical protein
MDEDDCDELENADHIVLTNGLSKEDPPNGSLWCTHCGYWEDLGLPRSVNGVLALMNQFRKDHAGCERLDDIPVGFKCRADGTKLTMLWGGLLSIDQICAVVSAAWKGIPMPKESENSYLALDDLKNTVVILAEKWTGVGPLNQEMNDLYERSDLGLCLVDTGKPLPKDYYQLSGFMQQKLIMAYHMIKSLLDLGME